MRTVALPYHEAPGVAHVAVVLSRDEVRPCLDPPLRQRGGCRHRAWVRRGEERHERVAVQVGGRRAANHVHQRLWASDDLLSIPIF